ncbi:MAG: hypothetical protein ACPGVK_10795 [Halocynthiibacter sp.]
MGTTYTKMVETHSFGAIPRSTTTEAYWGYIVEDQGTQSVDGSLAKLFFKVLSLGFFIAMVVFGIYALKQLDVASLALASGFALLTGFFHFKGSNRAKKECQIDRRSGEIRLVKRNARGDMKAVKRIPFADVVEFEIDRCPRKPDLGVLTAHVAGGKSFVILRTDYEKIYGHATRINAEIAGTLKASSVFQG